MSIGMNEDQFEQEPSNVVVGLIQGLTSAVSGVVSGAVTLVSAPLLGASSGGIGGLAVGIGAGVVAAVTLPTMGILLCGIKIGQGIANTPESILAFIRSKPVDETTRPMSPEDQEAADIIDEQLYAESRRFVEREVAPDEDKLDSAALREEYKSQFDVLGLSLDASSADIMRAYYTKALAVHPDTNKSPEAHEQFSQLSKAYFVLSRIKRKKGAQPEISHLDPAQVFAVVFGSPAFDDHTGKLSVAAAIEMGFDEYRDTVLVDPVKLTEFQAAREDSLVQKLTDRVNVWSIDQEAFVRNSVEEAARLNHTCLGAEFLKLVGSEYVSLGQRMLGYYSSFGIAGRMGYFTEKYRIWKSQFRAITSSIELDRLRKISKEVEGIVEFEEIEKDILSCMFFINALDIESTLRIVCKRVCRDKLLDKEKQESRCIALIKLGQIFLSASKEEK
jgi:curved DNA-binding protein CbpA